MAAPTANDTAGVRHAWDSSTEPEFEEKLEWMRTFVRDEIIPLETLDLDAETFRRITDPMTGAMDVAPLLLELYGRIPPLAEAAVADVDLHRAPAPGANPVGWLVWHAARVQDHHIAELLGEEQLWVTGTWAARFGLDPDPSNTGYGHSPGEVAAVRPDGPDALLDYLSAVDARTRSFLEGVAADDLDRIVDTRWDPHVTLGVRLVSVADDCLQHVGQAAYVRGLLGR